MNIFVELFGQTCHVRRKFGLVQVVDTFDGDLVVVQCQTPLAIIDTAITVTAVQYEDRVSYETSKSAIIQEERYEYVTRAQAIVLESYRIKGQHI